MNIGDKLATLLKEYGIEYVFGVPGGQTIAFYRGIFKSKGMVQHVLMRDERSAGFAADAYARITGRTGVCDATVGPGATNLVSPLAEAYASSIPVLAIIADIPRNWEHRRRRGNASQALTQNDLFRGISKWQANLTTPEALDDLIDSAFRIANSGRPGPVVIIIPDDIFMANVSSKSSSERIRSSIFPQNRPGPHSQDIHKAIRLIEKAEKPILFIGGGALISNAFEEVKILAEKLNCPVASTLSGKGIIREDHPLSIGVAGLMGRPVVNQIICESDLPIFIGTKVGQIGTLSWTFPNPDVPVIHIDIDPEEIGRNHPNTFPIVSDAKIALVELNDALKDSKVSSAWDIGQISKKVLDWYRDDTNKPQVTNELIKPQAIMDAMNRFITEDDVVVSDASLCAGWAGVYINLLKAGRKYLAPRGLAGLGWGAPAAIGAALATNKSSRILHFAGDGGFSYSVQELEVMARLNLPILSIIFNNDTLAWIKHSEINRFKDECIKINFEHVDFSKVSMGFGGRGYTVRTLSEFSSAMEKEKCPDGPAVIDVKSDSCETPVINFMQNE